MLQLAPAARVVVTAVWANSIRRRRFNPNFGQFVPCYFAGNNLTRKCAWRKNWTFGNAVALMAQAVYEIVTAHMFCDTEAQGLATGSFRRFRPDEATRLPCPEIRIKTVLCKQGVMRSNLSNPPLIKNNYPVHLRQC